MIDARAQLANSLDHKNLNVRGGTKLVKVVKFRLFMDRTNV